jgi:RNA-directed DNA polymerase
MNRWSSQHFSRQGKEEGVSPDVLESAIASAKALLSKSPLLPPLFTLRHIAHETDVPYNFLRGIIERNEEMESYRVFKLKKPDVGHAMDRFRFICVPHPLLLKTQRWINREILVKVPTHEASFAYTQGSGILPAAQMHVGCKWLIKLDVTNFFESILESDVYHVFNEIGYQPLVAFELARLCTRIRASRNPIRTKKRDPNLPGFPYHDVRIGHLPQGAATSPLLANLVARPLDDALLALAQKEGLVYTRYADDLTFSSLSQFSRPKALEFVHQVYDIIRQYGLWPNKAKTKIVPPGARKIILGLLVDGATPRLTKEFKARVRTHTYFLLRKDVGPSRHAQNRGFDSVLGLQRHVYGLVAYAAGIEPDWARLVRAE